MPVLDPWILVAILTAALGCGAWWLGRRPSGMLGPGPRPAPPAPRPTAGSALPAAGMDRLISAFHDWFAALDDSTQLWPALDQHVRETLAEHLGATRVRCFHVRPGDEGLETIAQSGRPAAGARANVRTGLIGYVVTSGRMYVAGDSSHGPLVDELARHSEEQWTCIWPIRDQDVTIGAVATCLAPGRTAAPRAQLAAVGGLLSIGWRLVAATERLRIASRVDPGSGVLRRHDFFTLAQRMLADAYAGNEPVVAACLGLEGLRRLDDAGSWQQRDAVIERLGRLIQQRVRSDDLVGRFSDDRFVILLRRLDSQLAELIIATLLLSAEEMLAELGVPTKAVVVRGGLAGSGLMHKTLDDLLTRAFESLDGARHSGRTLMTDLESPAAGGQS